VRAQVPCSGSEHTFRTWLAPGTFVDEILGNAAVNGNRSRSPERSHDREPTAGRYPSTDLSRFGTVTRLSRRYVMTSLRSKVPEPAKRVYRSVREFRRDRAEPWRKADRRDTTNIKLMIAFRLGEGDDAVDVGANRGEFLERIVHCAPRGQHLAFEPQPALSEQLAQRYPSATVFPLALADFDGSAEFEIVDTNSPLSSLEIGRDLTAFGSPERRSIEVEVRRLDSVIPRGYSPSFIKVDVEGSEVAFLRGAMRTLRHSKPLIVLEHGLGAENEEFWQLLTVEAGLRMFSIDGIGPLERNQFLDLISGGNRWNWLCHP